MPVWAVRARRSPVEWHDVEVLGQIHVPALVGLAHGDEPGRVGQPGRLGELELARGEVPRRRGAVGRDDVDVLGRSAVHPTPSSREKWWVIRRGG